MNFIVCVAENWAIGQNGTLLFHLPKDLAYFRSVTSGKTVVMGRATLESLPGGRPLPNRDNIVLSTNPAFSAPGCTVCHGLDELCAVLSTRASEEVFVIGGGAVYRQLIPYCRLGYVTRVDQAPQADCFLPDLELSGQWALRSRSETQYENGCAFTFDLYENTAPHLYRGRAL